MPPKAAKGEYIETVRPCPFTLSLSFIPTRTKMSKLLRWLSDSTTNYWTSSSTSTPTPTLTPTPQSNSPPNQPAAKPIRKQAPRSEWHNLTGMKDTGNKISRRSQIHGTHHITLGGKSIIMADAVVRGDLFRAASSSSSSTSNGAANGNAKSAANPAQNIAISLGRYTFISRSVILRPPSRLARGVHTYTTLHIGHHVFVGERSVIEAAKVEDNVTVGKDCVVGSMVILKERCQVLDGAVVPANMVVPSLCVVAGQPARIVGEVPIAYGVEGMEGGLSRERYRSVR